MTTEERLYVTATAIKHDWVLKDIPAFGDEVYLTTPENYLDKISFQLSGHATGQRSYTYHDSWKTINAELLQIRGLVQPWMMRMKRLAGWRKKFRTMGMKWRRQRRYITTSASTIPVPIATIFA